MAPPSNPRHPFPAGVNWPLIAGHNRRRSYFKAIEPRMSEANTPSHPDPHLTFLASRINYEKMISIPYQSRDFRLDCMRELLALLGNPQDRLKIIHVAGTKGKGSTSAMIAAALSAAGYRCGLYTSPHLDHLEERFMIDGQPCSTSQLASLVERGPPLRRTA